MGPPAPNLLHKRTFEVFVISQLTVFSMTLKDRINKNYIDDNDNTFLLIIHTPIGEAVLLGTGDQIRRHFMCFPRGHEQRIDFVVLFRGIVKIMIENTFYKKEKKSNFSINFYWLLHQNISNNPFG